MKDSSKTDRIRVLHVLTDSNIGGAGTYVSTYVKNCDSSKIDCTVALPRGSAVSTLIPGSIELDIAPDRSFDLKSIRILRRFIKTHGFDIVHAHGSLSARLAAKGVCDSVFTKHTLSKTPAGLFSRLFYSLPGDYAIAVSEAARQNLTELGFDKKRIYTVYNGVDAASRLGNTKALYGIPEDSFTVGCVARFHPVKDHKTLLDAAKKVILENKKVTFLLVGDGELLDSCKQYARDIGIDGKCVFTGRLTDSFPAYNAMDAYCIASKQESFGLSLVEAWSEGLPAVVSDAEGFAEISQDGVSALVCKAGDSDDFADKLLMLVNDSELAQKLAQNGFAQYEKNFTAKTFASNVTDVYCSIKNKK